MPLIYLSGQSGASKSTIRTSLVRLGYEAHDTDEDGFTAWYNIETGKIVDWVTAKRDSDWLKQHAHMLSAEKVLNLSNKSKITGLPIFLCGIPSNGLDFITLYDEVIFIAIDSQTMQQRVLNRITNNFGKRPEELQQMLYWHDKMLETYTAAGATVLDGNQPIETILEQILARLDKQSTNPTIPIE